MEGFLIEIFLILLIILSCHSKVSHNVLLTIAVSVINIQNSIHWFEANTE